MEVERCLAPSNFAAAFECALNQMTLDLNTNRLLLPEKSMPAICPFPARFDRTANEMPNCDITSSVSDTRSQLVITSTGQTEMGYGTVTTTLTWYHEGRWTVEQLFKGQTVTGTGEIDISPDYITEHISEDPTLLFCVGWFMPIDS